MKTALDIYRSINDADQVKGDPTVIYDHAGNQTNSTAFPLITYNGINQTSSITAAGQSPLTLAYAGAGQADRNQTGGTTQQNGSMGVQVDKTAGLTTTYVRDPGGELIDEKFSTGESLYYYFDGLGSVIGLLDAGGNLRAKYTYDPFGAHATATSFNGALPTNPFRWMSGYLDSTGLYHFGERYYDSAHGRFLQMDPSGQDANGYAYAGGNPVNFTDPSGLRMTWRKALSLANQAASFVAMGATLFSVVCPLCAPVTGTIATVAEVTAWGTGVAMAIDACSRGKNCGVRTAQAAANTISLGGAFTATKAFGKATQLAREFRFGFNTANFVSNFTFDQAVT